MTLLKRLSSQQADFMSALEALLRRDAEQSQSDRGNIPATVSDIIASVREQGDQALFDYTRQFDRFSVDADNIEIPIADMQSALGRIDTEQRRSLEFAAQRIRDYHTRQRQESWQFDDQDGNRLGQKVTPLARVGLYVPGGKAAYPSSVLMNAIPAKVAGVDELIMVSPTPDGETNDMVLAAAAIAGIDRVLRVGGAQAVAALAYGTQSMPGVDKIVGPGNAYVAEAKKQVFGQVGIDMIAGPSEILIIADDSVNSDWVAMDLFAQAEHDEMAQSILLTKSDAVADAVLASINKLLPDMPRKQVIETALANNGAVIVVQSEQEIIDIADHIAAEHLEIFTHNAEELSAKITNAGAMFIGKYSAESLGDYCVGPNHVLPTSGTARFSSPLGVYDFQKRTSIIHCSVQGAENLAENASVLARGESLVAHARSAEFRKKTIK